MGGDEILTRFERGSEAYNARLEKVGKILEEREAEFQRKLGLCAQAGISLGRYNELLGIYGDGLDALIARYQGDLELHLATRSQPGDAKSQGHLQGWLPTWEGQRDEASDRRGKGE